MQNKQQPKSGETMKTSLDSQAMEIKKEDNQPFGRGVKLSHIKTTFEDATIDVTSLRAAFQRLGFLKIVYNPSVDEEPLVQITDKGKQQVNELLRALQHAS